MGYGEAEEKVSMEWWSGTAQVRGVLWKLSLEMLSKSTHGTNISQSSSLGCLLHCRWDGIEQHFWHSGWDKILLNEMQGPLQVAVWQCSPSSTLGWPAHCFWASSITTGAWGRENGKEVWAKGSSGLISDVPWTLFSPFSPVSSVQSSGVVLELARQAGLQRAGQALELGTIILWLAWKLLF